MPRKDTASDRNKARDAFINSSKLDMYVEYFEKTAMQNNELAFWADAALLAIASRKDGSPEYRARAAKAIEDAWQRTSRRAPLMRAAAEINCHHLDSKILLAANDPDETTAQVANRVKQQLKIKTETKDNTPKVGSLTQEEVIATVVSKPGDIARGQEVFAKANCAACHTVRQDEVQKGPYLGTIAKTYKRPELTTAILEPSKTIAQGFVTNLIMTKDGEVRSGFVTSEQNDRVTIRDQKGVEFTVLKEEIEERKTSPTSVMPTGVMNEFTTYDLASLVDYLESLSK